MKHFLLAALLSVSASAALATPITDLSPITAPVVQENGAMETAWIRPYLPPILQRLGCLPAPCCGPLCRRN